jgi:hypothetical protein
MLSRCPKCGFENKEQHRFCGMCGTRLTVPISAPASSSSASSSTIPAPPVRETRLPESPSQRMRTGASPPQQRTSSILGLGDEPIVRATPPVGETPESPSQRLRTGVSAPRERTPSFLGLGDEPSVGPTVRESPWERIPSQAHQTSAPRERPPQPVSGPSFLGLGGEPARDLDYLLEDEEPTSGHKSMSIVLLLLLAGVIYAGWRWRAEIYPRAAWALHRLQEMVPRSSSSNSSQTAAAPTEPPPVSGTESHTITRQDEHSTTPPEKTDTAKQQAPTETNATASTPPSNAPASAEPASQPKTPQSAESQSNQSSQSQESVTKPDEAAAAESESVPAKSAKPPAAVPKAQKRETQATSLDTSDEKLVADGEKYLYGNGVPENCDRAQKNLQTAAQHSNPKAQTMLGAMYATGHCAARDLPTAYRWFARALHGDPGNNRLQRDLEILWKAMTPDERQLAMRRE